jgi:splicing factor 3B subunit 1
VAVILIRQFQPSDEEMKIILKVVKQSTATNGVTVAFSEQDIFPDFFKSFWVCCMVCDRRKYKQVVETMVRLAQKAGASEIIG